MSVENEFAQHWVTFHANMDSARSLLGLYPDESVQHVFESNKAATADFNEDLVRLLQIKDERILRIFHEWEHPDETGSAADAILEKRIGGSLLSILTYTYWKYCDVVSLFGAVLDRIRQQVLLDQAIVASCTAYERILKDLIPWVLKNHEPAAKAYLGTLNRPVKSLGRFDFDALRNVDAIFLNEPQGALFPVFPDVVDFYNRTLGVNLFPSTERAREINGIFNVRNCIVHNAGKPDEWWVRRAGGAEYNTDLTHTRKYVADLHAELHNAGIAVFRLLDLDLDKARFLTAECDPPFEWKLDETTADPRKQSGKVAGNAKAN